MGRWKEQFISYLAVGKSVNLSELCFLIYRMAVIHPSHGALWGFHEIRHNLHQLWSRFPILVERGSNPNHIHTFKWVCLSVVDLSNVFVVPQTGLPAQLWRLLYEHSWENKIVCLIFSFYKMRISITTLSGQED